MNLFKKSLRIGFVVALSSIFVYCTGNTNKADNDKGNDKAIIINDNDVKQEAPHKYDITLTMGDETISYTGNVDMGGTIPSLYVHDGENYVGDNDASVITLTLNDLRDFTIDGLFVLDKTKGGEPLPIKQAGLYEGLASTLRLIDHQADRVFTGVSGTVVFNNIERFNDPGLSKNEDVASYTLDFKGEFELMELDTGEKMRYEGTGKVFIGVPLKK